MVKVIAFWGADINIRGDDGLTPLHYAAKFKIIAKDDPAQQDIIYASNQYKSKTGIKDNVVMNVNSASTLDIKKVGLLSDVLSG
jgi:hypothetical protein